MPDFLLLESGDELLTEDGDRFLLQSGEAVPTVDFWIVRLTANWYCELEPKWRTRAPAAKWSMGAPDDDP